MAGGTISNHVTLSVTLGSGVYVSPLTVTPAGFVDPIAGGFYGATGLTATIAGGSVLNQGTIAGAGGVASYSYPSATIVTGGSGVYLAHGGLTNDGTIAGGAGYGNSFGFGGSGGAGIIGHDGSVINNGTVLGGNSGTYRFGTPGEPGIFAGFGADLTNSSLANYGVISGGKTGGSNYSGTSSSAIGVNASGASFVTNSGAIIGGSAGYIRVGAADSGGAGVSLSIGATLVNLDGSILGGSGGSTYTGINGGSGGTGVDATMGTVNNNGGNISGGGGGMAGGPEAPGNGGRGGTGVDLTGGSLVNSGAIGGGGGGEGGRGSGGDGGTGVSLSAGAVLTNTGQIFGGGGGSFQGLDPFVAGGGTGLVITGSTATNDGMIAGGQGGSGGEGVDLVSGVLINNDLISGGGEFTLFYNDIGVNAAGGTLVNNGTITASYFGVRGFAGALVTNAASGVISGGSGVSISGGGTLLNAGTIVSSPSGSGAYPGTVAVNFSGTGTDLLIDDPGAVFVGSVIAQGTVATLELASAAGTGTISGIGSSFSGFGTITVDAGATWVAMGSVTASGTVGLGAGCDMVFDDGVAAASPVRFLTNTGSLGIGSASGFAATVVGFQRGDAIDFTSISSAGSITAGVDGSNDLTLTSGESLLAEIKMDPAQSFASVSFTAVSDGGSGTVVTENAPLCFLAGTMIATPDGEIPVERLAVGGLVVTASGAVRPIVWIGRGRVLATRGRRSAATPVIVRKGALGANVPYRDLLVTRAHALWLDDVLIPVEFLVNHRSILWDDRAQEAELYHIELETHDVLVADGAPAESYRDDGNRWLFQNGNIGWGQPAKAPFAPVLTGGALVDAVWLRLLRQAGARPGLPLTDRADLHLLVDGRRVDAVSRTDEFHVFRAVVPGTMCIASRAAVPQELGMARDPRCLGVAVRQVVVRQRARSMVIPADDERLADGFHAFEAAERFRWTDGNAVLPAALFAGFAGAVEVVVQCVATARYVDEGKKRQVA